MMMTILLGFSEIFCRLPIRTSQTLVSLILQKIGMNKLPTMMSDRVAANSHVQGKSHPWYAISPGIPEKEEKISRTNIHSLLHKPISDWVGRYTISRYVYHRPPGGQGCPATARQIVLPLHFLKDVLYIYLLDSRSNFSTKNKTEMETLVLLY